MPWPWKLVRACMDLKTGNLLIYPANGAFKENEFFIDAMTYVWRVWKLFNTPMSEMVGNQVVTVWTPADIELYDWLMSDA